MNQWAAHREELRRKINAEAELRRQQEIEQQKERAWQLKRKAIESFDVNSFFSDEFLYSTTEVSF